MLRTVPGLENAEIMRNKNFDVWKGLYESVYGEELSY
jgi:hypothetical protein